MSENRDVAPATSEVSIENAEVENQVEGQNVHINVESSRVPVGRIALGTAAVLGVLFLAFVIYTSLNMLLLLFIALLVATAIEPLVNVLRRGPFSRSAGILIVYSGLFIVLGVIGYILVTVFVSQIGDLGASLDKTIRETRASVDSMDN